MYKIISIALIITLSNIAYSQFDNNCLNKIKQPKKDINTTGIKYVVLNEIEDKGFDSTCEIYVFGLYFDFLLDKGLNLDFSVKDNCPVLWSTNLPADSPYIKKLEKNIIEYNMYIRFLDLKDFYEKRILNIISEEKMIGELEKVLGVHDFKNPIKVKNILMSHYRDVSVSTVQRELMELNSQQN